VAGLVVVALVVLAVVVATRPSSQAASVDSPLVGHPVPPISARSFEGQLVSLAADRGEVVVVNFFASWCPPCAEEEPNLARFAFVAEEQGLPVKLVSVDIDDSTAGARRFLTQWGVSWPTLPDQSGRFASEFGVGSPPMTFFVDRTGTVVAAFAGPMSYGQLISTAAAARRA
jgi:cytochrome c biogenesis protein CcmG/thiol:disulfide interchange protein DsbE